MPIFFVENCGKLVENCGKSFSLFAAKNISAFGYEVVKHFMSSPLNKLVKVTML